MGVFLNVIGDYEVSDVHIEEAGRLLIELRRPELWQRMELRAKMVYTAIRSRLAQLKYPEKPAEAIKLAKRALRLAKQGQFLKEQQSISYNLNSLSESTLQKQRLRKAILV
ncbi:hypothetical protein KP79_PYT12257 [Mizuhopecten yessoensis]|uniref:Uncharacterized protein n=1 Tax=Mizuhopecten yessoensis TaxID=6573 RepID=A0A210QUN4_MIZYE|nr:hypothetical protein KP79_PYT12257 [Mizuhopecten yessoensis]